MAKKKRVTPVLWGFHPAHNNGMVIKICDYTPGDFKRRTQEGWTCAAYYPGVAPDGLIWQSLQANKERVRA